MRESVVAKVRKCEITETVAYNDAFAHRMGKVGGRVIRFVKFFTRRPPKFGTLDASSVIFDYIRDVTCKVKEKELKRGGERGRRGQSLFCADSSA